MQLMHEIPDKFWGLFRSNNRSIYIEALLKINEEYQYNNYFLSWEVCIQVLSNYFSEQRISMVKEEQESELELLEPPATRTLKRLVKAQWLKKLEDFGQGVTNIVIPDYAAVFIDAFERLTSEQDENTDVYIQNVYAILFAYRNDSRKDPKLLNTALISTRELNKVLQNMLHNMDKFFTSLLNKEFYGDLLEEHLDGYVEEIVKKKYHILKTTDNFYQYKMDIKNWIKDIEEKEIQKLSLLEDEEMQREEAERIKVETSKKKIISILETVENIERGFRDIEYRIFFMDKEHSKYVRATVTRLNYLLNEDRDMKGLMVQLLNVISTSENEEEQIKSIAAHMNFSHMNILSEKSLYKRRKNKAKFIEHLEPYEEQEELTREEVLKLNRIHNRYSKKQIEHFIEEKMTDNRYEVNIETVIDDESFEKLILAYDYSIRKDSKFRTLGMEEEQDMVLHGRYQYPKLTFVRKP